MVGESTSMWLVDLLLDSVRRLDKNCNFIDYIQSTKELICLNQYKRELNLASKDGHLEMHIKIGEHVFPLVYFSELKMLLAVEGKKSTMGTEDYEPILISEEGQGMKATIRSGISTKLKF